MRIRPMRPNDVDAAEQIAARAFAPAVAGPGNQRTSKDSSRPPQARQRWTGQVRHLVEVDAGGSWVADDDGSVVGIAVSARRDLLWILSTYAVDPGYQRRGIGRALLEAAVGYGRGCLRGMVCALPNHPALRLYRAAGFTLYPTMRLAGVVDRDALPEVDGVRVATQADLDLVDSVDRQVRGATHRPDHPVMTGHGPLLVCDILTGRGYAYLDQSCVALLAATSKSVARRLLWAALTQLASGGDVVVRYLTSEQEWAVDVGLAAGLRIEQDGYLALRHMRPPTPYIPSAPFG